MSKGDPTRPPPGPLSEAECQRLSRRESRAVLLFLGGWAVPLGGFVGGYALSTAGQFPGAERGLPAAFGLGVALLLTATAAHLLRARCPRCGCRYGLYTRQPLPPECAH